MRPEHQAPPEVFYDEEGARKYSENSRNIKIQTEMAERAIEMLDLPPGWLYKYLIVLLDLNKT